MPDKVKQDKVMRTADAQLKQPPWLKNAAGDTRRVGVELEMNGLTLDAFAAQVANFYRLDGKPDGRYERVLQGDPAGDWVVELDYDLLKRLGRRERKDETLIDDIDRTTEDVLAWAAEMLVPVEIVSPQLPLDRLADVEALIVKLREAGAKGSSFSPVNAFGLQLNPELPSHDPDLITACLKAFMCLQDWLFMRADIDLTRRMTSYVDPFPIDYIEQLLATDYRPDLATLIDDYLAHNPTRNRALDMLPLFMFLDEERVRASVDDVRIKPRPTFHYRLPGCEIDQADWGLHVPWNDWVEVEYLAADTDRLAACSEAYRKFLGNPLDRLFKHWASTVEEQWLRR
jgi:hypothetical protein